MYHSIADYVHKMVINISCHTLNALFSDQRSVGKHMMNDKYMFIIS